MRLIYFDETKFSEDNPFFFIGGILLPEENITSLENTLIQIQYNFFSTNRLDNNTELHGQFIFNWKGVYRKRKLQDRIKLFEDIGDVLIHNKVPIRIVCVDVERHQKNINIPNLNIVLVWCLSESSFVFILIKLMI